MIAGIIGIIGITIIIIYLEYRITCVVKHVKDHCAKVDLLMLDFLKRNKIKVKGIKYFDI